MQLGSFQVKFYHQSEGKNKGTAVELYNGATLLSTANAKTHSNDVFSKAKGRKIALSRVLNNAEIERTSRKEVWNSYWEKCKN